jgi:hypothetical protein
MVWGKCCKRGAEPKIRIKQAIVYVPDIVAQQVGGSRVVFNESADFQRGLFVDQPELVEHI